jgi:hypothetical protein
LETIGSVLKVVLDWRVFVVAETTGIVSELVDLGLIGLEFLGLLGQFRIGKEHHRLMLLQLTKI